MAPKGAVFDWVQYSWAFSSPLITTGTILCRWLIYLQHFLRVNDFQNSWIPFYWRLHNCSQKVLQLMPQHFNGVWKHLQYRGVANNFAYRGACPYMAIILFWPHISNNASAKVVEIKVKVVVLGWTVRSTELATALATSLMAVNWESDRNMFHSPFRIQVSHVLPWNCRPPPVYFSCDYWYVTITN